MLSDSLHLTLLVSLKLFSFCLKRFQMQIDKEKFEISKENV